MRDHPRTNGHLETPRATAELQLEVRDILFKERFLVMTNLTNPLIGLLFLQKNSTVLDVQQGLLIFPFFSIQLKHADNTYSNIIEPLLTPLDIMIPPATPTVNYIKSQVYTENEVTGTLQPSFDREDNDDFIICPPLATVQNRQFTVLINNFLEHSSTFKKG